MDTFESLVKILFKTSTENTEFAPHRDGIEILQELKAFLETFGVTVVIQEYNKRYSGEDFLHGNLIARKGDFDGEYIGLQGHIDTVPCNAPYVFTKTDTELIGRGSVDMKGPLIGVILSFLELVQSGIENVILIITDDEETDFMGIEKLIEEKENLLPKIQFCINAEPTELKPSFLTRGFGQYELSTKGYTAHSSSSKNDFLIEKMIPVIDAVGAYVTKVREISDPILGETRAAFTMINSGKKTNQLPEDFYLTFNMRLVKKDVSVYKELFDTMVRPLCGADIEIKELFFEPFNSNISEETKEKLQQVFVEQGVQYEEAIMHAFTEAYMFTKVGVPCFSWGPGSMDLAHVVPQDERIKILDILKYKKLLVNFIKNTP